MSNTPASLLKIAAAIFIGMYAIKTSAEEMNDKCNTVSSERTLKAATIPVALGFWFESPKIAPGNEITEIFANGTISLACNKCKRNKNFYLSIISYKDENNLEIPDQHRVILPSTENPSEIRWTPTVAGCIKYSITYDDDTLDPIAIVKKDTRH